MRSTLLVFLALAGLALPTAANAHPEGWYLGLGGGWTSLAPVNYAIAPPAAVPQSKADFADSGTFGASVGYRFPIPLRVEADFGFADYRANFLPLTGLSGSSVSGGISTASFVTSAVYDIPLWHQFSVSLGFGLGAAELDPTIRDPQGTHINDPQLAFTWRVIGGFTVSLSDNLEFQVDYRYQEIGGSSHTAFSNAASPVSLGIKHVQSALASLRWYVDIP
ncbi:MAG TPA: outer membrane beta-barrel protein [Rhizomicrobium sp.]|nr:outer membrane beta-barrel protein [Rhizomicrobium sp.]